MHQMLLLLGFLVSQGLGGSEPTEDHISVSRKHSIPTPAAANSYTSCKNQMHQKCPQHAEIPTNAPDVKEGVYNKYECMNCGIQKIWEEAARKGGEVCTEGTIKKFCGLGIPNGATWAPTGRGVKSHHHAAARTLAPSPLPPGSASGPGFGGKKAGLHDENFGAGAKVCTCSETKCGNGNWGEVHKVKATEVKKYRSQGWMCGTTPTLAPSFAPSAPPTPLPTPQPTQRGIAPTPLPPTPAQDQTADKHPSCGPWALNGECARNPDYMLISCAKSCAKYSTKAPTPSAKVTGTYNICKAKMRVKCSQYPEIPTNAPDIREGVYNKFECVECGIQKLWEEDDGGDTCSEGVIKQYCGIGKPNGATFAPTASPTIQHFHHTAAPTTAPPTSPTSTSNTGAETDSDGGGDETDDDHAFDPNIQAPADVGTDVTGKHPVADTTDTADDTVDDTRAVPAVVDADDNNGDGDGGDGDGAANDKREGITNPNCKTFAAIIAGSNHKKLNTENEACKNLRKRADSLCEDIAHQGKSCTKSCLSRMQNLQSDEECRMREQCPVLWRRHVGTELCREEGCRGGMEKLCAKYKHKVVSGWRGPYKLKYHKNYFSACIVCVKHYVWMSHGVKDYGCWLENAHSYCKVPTSSYKNLPKGEDFVIMDYDHHIDHVDKMPNFLTRIPSSIKSLKGSEEETSDVVEDPNGAAR